MADDTHNHEESQPRADAERSPEPHEPAPPAKSGRVTIPLARPAGDEAAPLGIVDDTCPRCHATLAHDAVMCVKCGYDLKANVVREPGVGVVEVEPPRSTPADTDFVVPGRGSAQVLATTGVFLTLGALIFSGMNAERAGFWVVVGTIALTLYNIAVHTGTGIAAVIAAARLCEQKFGRLDIAAARMFVAVSLFHLVTALHIPIHAGLAQVLKWAAAMGLYYLAVWLLFKKDRYGAMLIALSHFGLWVLLQLGSQLSGWLGAATNSAATAG